MIKYNGSLTIEKVIEQYTHGSLEYDEVSIDVRRATDEVVIRQGDNTIFINVDQVMQLERFLREHLE